MDRRGPVSSAHILLSLPELPEDQRLVSVEEARKLWREYKHQGYCVALEKRVASLCIPPGKVLVCTRGYCALFLVG